MNATKFDGTPVSVGVPSGAILQVTEATSPMTGLGPPTGFVQRDPCRLKGEEPPPPPLGPSPEVESNLFCHSLKYSIVVPGAKTSPAE